MSGDVVLLQSTPEMPPRIPPPRHRHGAPSAPWPFVDINDEVDPARIKDPNSHLPLSAAACDHAQTPTQEVCWCKYPQSLYPNWTPRQQEKSKMTKVTARRKETCTIYYLDVMEDGFFVNGGAREVNEHTQDGHWHTIQKERPPGVRIRALFVDGLSGPVLQMLGTRYNIEPFFFSSTIGWIPSRHQSNVVLHESDHITITLTFIRSIQNPITVPPNPDSSDRAASVATRNLGGSDLIIDTQLPLPLRSSNFLLVADHLALHMIRSRTSSTIISLHPSPVHRVTTAKFLHSRIRAAGRSVYWSNIFRDSTDPTFVFLSYLWYAVYAWDEALENLYNHICSLEIRVMDTNDTQLAQELHVIRAHIFHYESFLEDFKKTVLFVLKTPYLSAEPLPDSDLNTESHASRNWSAVIMKRECDNLLSEIDRLEKTVKLHDKRLKNVIDLNYGIVNIEDSRRMKQLTEASIKDSAAIKQYSYLTMAFLPGSFVSAVFGMNVKEVTNNPKSHTRLSQYIAISIPLTVLTIWMIVAYQIQIKEPEPLGDESADELAGDNFFAFGGVGSGGSDKRPFKRLDLWARLMWPVVLFSTLIERRKRLNDMRSQKMQARLI